MEHAEFGLANARIIAVKTDSRSPGDLLMICSTSEVAAVVLQLRVWSSTSNYWPLRCALTERGKAALEAAGLSIPFPQRDLHIKGGSPEAPGSNAARKPVRHTQRHVLGN